MRRNFSFKRLLDGVWLLALAIYAVSGVGLSTFHGDEAMLTYATHDYATMFIYRQPQQLLTGPPYIFDSEQHLRMLNGSVQRYTSGFAWHVAGFTTGDLTDQAPGWDWGQSYETNVENGKRPTDALLHTIRAPQALFFSVSIVVMFVLAHQFVSHPFAYFVSAIYGLHPILLLQGRRTVLEGSVLCFGLLTILLAAMLSKHLTNPANSRRLFIGWWAALVLSAGLTVASKHSGAVYVAAAWLWLLASVRFDRPLRSLSARLVTLFVCGVLSIAWFVALSPALWNDPIPRLQDLVRLRNELLSIQVLINEDAPTSLPQRVAGIVTQPFVAPVVHYEIGNWRGVPDIEAEMNRWAQSPLPRWPRGGLLVVALTVLAGAGLFFVLWPPTRRSTPQNAIGLMLWLGIVLVGLLANPMPWQRYYLPLIPIYCLMAGIGLQGVFYTASKQTRTQTRLQTVPL